jgi:hypothetical protein
MAHFAKIGLNNKVLEVVTINNIDCMTPQGVEYEAIGVAYLQKLTGHSTWVQTSFNNRIRKNFAGIDYTFNFDLDAFIPPKPYASWTLNSTTCQWEPPVPLPLEENMYFWDENLKEWKI